MPPLAPHAHAAATLCAEECCANAPITGPSCASIAATGLFCNTTGEQRYQITEFGPDGSLVPAVGNSSEYLQRVGAEEYMVVDMIEPFETNAKASRERLMRSCDAVA